MQLKASIYGTVAALKKQLGSYPTTENLDRATELFEVMVAASNQLLEWVQKKKKCRKCGETRPVHDFGSHYNKWGQGDGMLSTCKYCNTPSYLGRDVGYIRSLLGVPAGSITPEMFELKAAQIAAKELSKEIKTKLKEKTK